MYSVYYRFRHPWHYPDNNPYGKAGNEMPVYGTPHRDTRQSETSKEPSLSNKTVDTGVGFSA
jgi:hypothetical protein